MWLELRRSQPGSGSLGALTADDGGKAGITDLSMCMCVCVYII